MGERRENGNLGRAALGGAVGTAIAAVGAIVAIGVNADLPWWAVAGMAVLAAGPAAWTGAQIGRRDGVRNEALEPGETVLGTYAVRPPFRDHTPPAAHEGPQYQLLVTNHGLQMWERSALLWRHPWPELRVFTEGPRLRIHRDGLEVGAMRFARAGAEQEVRLIAQRYAAV
ncbi:hypothetical protein ACIREE_28010 [Streptomyces sp. NPDC102467]|uniref:hypothetical protein n=1 Tax=Streptomyces sp. NPDC102467 TaxID=3366179 RepID=UPI0037F57C27